MAKGIKLRPSRESLYSRMWDQEYNALRGKEDVYPYLVPMLDGILRQLKLITSAIFMFVGIVVGMVVTAVLQ